MEETLKNDMTRLKNMHQPQMVKCQLEQLTKNYYKNGLVSYWNTLTFLNVKCIKLIIFAFCLSFIHINTINILERQSNAS